jgi:hypothetical protein
MSLTNTTENGRVWNAARKEHLVLLEKPLLSTRDEAARGLV